MGQQQRELSNRPRSLSGSVPVPLLATPSLPAVCPDPPPPPEGFPDKYYGLSEPVRQQRGRQLSLFSCTSEAPQQALT